MDAYNKIRNKRLDCLGIKFFSFNIKVDNSHDRWKIIMLTPVLIFQWLVVIADAIIYAVISFFGVIIVILAFAMADGDDYWAEGGMPLPGESKIESTD